MQKTLLILIFLVSALRLYAQDSKFSLEAHYPIPIDNNFIGKNYNGFMDVGLGYRIIELKPVKLGVSVNAGYLVDNNNIERGFDQVKVTSFLFQPRVFAEFNIEELNKFVPKISLGYTSMRINVSNPNSLDNTNTTNTFNGLNLNLGVSYNFSEKLFATLQYDFIKLSSDSVAIDSNFNRNVNILKIGFGLRF